MSAATGLPREYTRALCATGLQGLARGYSWDNVSWMMKQIRLETGRGTSPGIQDDFNAWGMGCVSVRPTNQIGCRSLPNGENLGKYASVEDSVSDRFTWDDYKGLKELRKSPAYPGEVNAQGYNASGLYSAAVHQVDDSDNRSVCYALGAIPVIGLLLVPIMKYLR